jgi:peptide/nickel transport system substrate-binding protein
MPSPDWHLPEEEVKRIYAQDIDGAKKLLAEAGFADGFDAEISVITSAAGYPEPELVQAQLRKINVRTSIKPLNGAEFSLLLSGQRPFQMSVSATSPVVTLNLDLYRKIHSNGLQNFYKLNDPELDRMIDQQAGMKDTAARKAAVLAIQRRIITQAPFMALPEPINIVFTQPKLRGFGNYGNLHWFESYHGGVWVDS